MGSSSRSTRLWQIHSLVLRSATSYKNIMGSSTSRGGGQRMGWLGLAADNWWGPWLSGRVCCCCCWRKTGEEHEGGNKRSSRGMSRGKYKFAAIPKHLNLFSSMRCIIIILPVIAPLPHSSSSWLPTPHHLHHIVIHHAAISQSSHQVPTRANAACYSMRDQTRGELLFSLRCSPSPSSSRGRRRGHREKKEFWSVEELKGLGFHTLLREGLMRRIRNRCHEWTHKSRKYEWTDHWWMDGCQFARNRLLCVALFALYQGITLRISLLVLPFNYGHQLQVLGWVAEKLRRRKKRKSCLPLISMAIKGKCIPTNLQINTLLGVLLNRSFHFPVCHHHLLFSLGQS